MPRPTHDQPEARALYDAVFSFAWRALKRLGCLEADRDEIAHRTVFKAHRGWSKYDDARGTPGQWLWGIVRHELAGFRRERGRQLPADAGPVPDVPDDARTAEEIVLLKDLVNSVWHRIPKAERQVVWHRHMAESTFEEIAEIEGISKSQAERLYQSGLARLRAEIARSEERRLRGVVPFPLTFGALFDLSHAPEPPPEVVERAWRRAVVELGLDSSPDSAPPASGPRSCASASADADNGPPSSGLPSQRLTKLHLALGPFGVVLGLLLAPLFPRCDNDRGRDEGAAALPASMVRNTLVNGAPSGSAVPVAANSAEPSVAETPGAANDTRRETAPATVARHAAGGHRPSTGGDGARLEDESSLLYQGRAALASGNLAAAFASVDEYTRRFGPGHLSVIRDDLWAKACARHRAAPQRDGGDIQARCTRRP